MKHDDKIWGTTIELFRNNTTSTHYLEIKAGGYCSEHRHAQKTNIFYVIEGELEIIRWDEGGEWEVLLRHGDGYERTVLVLPGKWHMFRAITDVKCVEIYEYCYDGVDIERRKEGGIGEIEKKGETCGVC